MDQPRERPLERLARKLDLHHRLSTEDRQAVLDLPHTVRKLEQQSYILREGDRPQHCAVLLSGYAVRTKILENGLRQIVSIAIPGEALDFQHMFLDRSDHNVQMLSRGMIANIPRHAVADLAMKRPKVARAMLVATLVEASVFREWVLNVGRRDSRSRVAHLLCEFAYRLEAQGLGPTGTHELPMTQDQLADATSLSAVQVNRVLQSLRREGLIDRNRRMVRIASWERIQEVAGFNPLYLHTREFAAAEVR